MPPKADLSKKPSLLKNLQLYNNVEMLKVVDPVLYEAYLNKHPIGRLCIVAKGVSAVAIIAVLTGYAASEGIGLFNADTQAALEPIELVFAATDFSLAIVTTALAGVNGVANIMDMTRFFKFANKSLEAKGKLHLLPSSNPALVKKVRDELERKRGIKGGVVSAMSDGGGIVEHGHGSGALDSAAGGIAAMMVNRDNGEQIAEAMIKADPKEVAAGIASALGVANPASKCRVAAIEKIGEATYNIVSAGCTWVLPALLQDSDNVLSYFLAQMAWIGIDQVALRRIAPPVVSGCRAMMQWAGDFFHGKRVGSAEEAPLLGNHG